MNEFVLRQRRKPDYESRLSDISVSSERSLQRKFRNITPPAVVEEDWQSNNIETTPDMPSRIDVGKDEGRIRKVCTRIFYGFVMGWVCLQPLYCGHIYSCILVALVETLLFRELVQVRYNVYFHIVQDTIPLFRTTQWLWFALAIFYTYSDFIVEIIKSNSDLHHLLSYARWIPSIAFSLYSCTFVLTICTLQTGHIKFQLNQLCWSIVVLCLTVGQLKYIMHNIYNGLFWYAFPISLVVTNDIFAYIAGMTCGRKFIKKSFVALSPNKTWEGFIGGGISTVVFSWYLSRWMSQFTWMTCPTNTFSFFPDKLDCELDPIFLEANSIFPPQIFDIFPVVLVKMIPGIVDVCAVGSNFSDLTACVSGDPDHVHHHFELMVDGVLPIQIHALSLGIFASVVAPFGGFLASAIKRAYGIKDFDSIIPGHGGLMDRFDCQFLMALCTWVHYNTFVKITTVSVPKLVYTYNLLRDEEKKEFLDLITQASGN